MSNSNLFSDRLREPLNETSRKARRNLMAASVIGVIISKVGLIPSKIAAFGVEFDSADQQALIYLLAASVAYFTICFAVYVYSELTAWKIVFASKEIEELKEASQTTSMLLHGFNEADKFKEHIKKVLNNTKSAFNVRLFIELGIPIIFATFSFISLLSYDAPEKTNKDGAKIEKVVVKQANKNIKTTRKETRASYIKRYIPKG